MAELITYEMLYEILREEKTKKEITRLDENFFENVIKYMSEKRNMLESQQKKSSIFTLSESVNTKKQLENVHRILKELYERRENKILQLALFRSRTNEIVDNSCMLGIEKMFFDDALKSMNEYRNAILANLLSEKEPVIERKDEPKELKSHEEHKGIKLVRITNAVPQFLGDDMHVYGPFEEEYVASLPEMVAEILVKKNKAEYL
ncbi:hypothetical protein J4231_00335 [Candidatus Woesearchaeota archaeon]|nr:hypothetical protein [Candidatus Woesearchaeota archaeon]